MGFILGAVTVTDTSSEFNGKTIDILVEDNIIRKIDSRIDSPDLERIELKGASVSPGWFDMSVHFNDPGQEYKEGISNGLDLLRRSGFTGAGLLPNTDPVLQRKTDISYVISKSERHPVALYPYGAVTTECAGRDLTEMIDMYHAGAIAFTDGLQSIDNADILLKTLMYLQKFQGLLLQRPQDKRLTLSGSMHEGKMSTMLGLKGMPSIAESLIVQRDLRILEYTGGKIHFSAISSEESVQLITEARKKGLNVTCDVAIYQLLLTDEDVGNYDTDMKVNPPLRDEKDRLALIDAVKNGVIDIITSHHIPQDEESKKMEFDLADFGMAGIQTFFSLINELSHHIPFDVLLKSFTTNPREILGLPSVSVNEGQVANLTIFNREEEWVFTESNNISASHNSPFLGKSLKGKVIGIVNQNEFFINE